MQRDRRNYQLVNFKGVVYAIGSFGIITNEPHNEYYNEATNEWKTDGISNYIGQHAIFFAFSTKLKHIWTSASDRVIFYIKDALFNFAFFYRYSIAIEMKISMIRSRLR